MLYIELWTGGLYSNIFQAFIILYFVCLDITKVLKKCIWYLSPYIKQFTKKKEFKRKLFLYIYFYVVFFFQFCTGFGAAWHLAYIEVEDQGTKKSYTFHCNKWLSKSDDDKQILRELTCSTAAKGGTPDMKDKSCKLHCYFLI